jgi:hypothetical protein
MLWQGPWSASALRFVKKINIELQLLPLRKFVRVLFNVLVVVLKRQIPLLFESKYFELPVEEEHRLAKSKTIYAVRWQDQYMSSSYMN